MEKYLLNGQAVHVVKIIEGGYLYQCIYGKYDDPNDPDFENEDLIDGEVTYFIETLYDNPPVEKFHKTITELQHRIEYLNKERAKIENLRYNESALLAEIKQRPFVQCLVDYLNGNFKYVLVFERMEIKEKWNIALNSHIKIVNSENGFELFILKNDNNESYDDWPIMVFNTFDDAQAFAKDKLICHLKYNTEKVNYLWNSTTIKEWYDKIHHSNKLCFDEELKKLYQDKFDAAKQREAHAKKAELLKDIEEKQKILNNIK